MTTIGYATLQLIPSLSGVSDSVNRQLGGLSGMGKKAGLQLGSGIAAGVRASESDIKRAADNYAKLYDRAADATGKLRTAEAQLQQLRKSGANDARIVAAEERSSKARRDELRLVNDAKVAYRELGTVRASQSGGGASFLSRFITEDNARSVGTKVGRVLGLSIAGAAGAGIAAIGYTLTKGFERLQSIDQATFKLKALGHSGDEVKTIMDNALASVKGTSFGLADAATAAASAVAAGVKPGQDLTKYLTEISDAAAVAGTSFSDMGAIFNSIQTLNKAFTGDLRQLSDRGLPIFEWLQKEYGVTAEKLNEMVQKGEVDSAHFKDAIDKNIGGAAKNMGQSFDGAVQNLEASVARLGANFITALLGGDQGGSALAGPTQAIGNLTTKFDEIGVWVTAHKDEIHGFFIDIKNIAMDVGGAVKDIGTWLVENKGAAETLAAVFVGWKVATTVLGVVESLQKMSVLLRTTLPADAAASAGAIGTGTGIGATGLIGGVFALAGALGVDLGFTIFDKMQKGARDAQAAMDEANRKLHEEFPGKPVTPTGVPAQTGSTAPNNPLNPNNIYGRATGGSILGRGSGTSDSIPAWLSHGEHVLTAKDVSAMGGQGGVYAFRSMLHRAGGGDIPLGADWIPRDPRRNAQRDRPSMGGGDRGPQGPISRKGPYNYGGDDVKRPGIWEGGTGWWATHGLPYQGKIRFPKDRFNPNDPNRKNRKNIHGFAGGGAVGPDVSAAERLVGHAYSQGSRFDCSGDVARVINAALGMDASGLMTTKTAQSWLAARGFVDGLGGPGQISVGWYDHGPNPNDGHMAMTLSDGRPAEGGGSHNAFLVGAGASGANSAQFDHHMHLALANALAPVAAAADNAAAPAGPGTGQGAPTSGGSGGGSLPSSISGLSAFGLDSLGSGVGTTGAGSDLGLFGKAAGAAVSGQASSALGVLGVNDSPGWLKAASQLVGGIKVSEKGTGKMLFDGSNPLGSLFGQGSSGSSAVPLSARSTATGTPPPDDAGNMHGTRAGQPPGPTYIINARDTEDAFIRAQRIEREKAAAKLSRF